MIFRSFVVILISVCVVAEPVNFHLEPIDFVDIKSHDGIRSYPVLKVSFVDPKYSKNMVLKSKVNPKSAKYVTDEKTKSEQFDNVRERLPMSSREDIKKMKKLSFHGRSPPQPVASALHAPNQANSSQKPTSLQQPNISQHSITLQQPKSSQQPTKIDLKQRKYTQVSTQVPIHALPQNNQRRSLKKIIKVHNKLQPNDEKGFQPLMRPSPINIHPADPPSFQTMRNYVDYLKLRQKQFFAELDDKNAAKQKLPSDEVEYFVKREQELAEEQRPRTEHHDVESASIETNNSDVDDGSDSAESREEKSREVEYEKNFEPSREENYEDESKNHEKFVPFRMYAQVRHMEAESHKPKSEAAEPKITQKLSLEKKNVFYQEEGYEEKDYDHGAAKVDHKYRSKRSVVPITSALVKKSESPNLKGEKVLKHLDELLKKSEAFLPDEDSDEILRRKDNSVDSFTSGSVKSYRSQKYPYYALPDSALNAMSAFRYSENLKNFPRAKESLYDLKNVKTCEEIDQEPNPVPKDIEQKGKSSEYNEKPQRLRGLGDKINCYKEKYFGRDPFDNPLFKEDFVSESIQIPFKVTKFLSHQANPLITVYDDVISNIRAAFAEDLRKKKEQELLSASELIPVTKHIKNNDKIPLNLNLNSGSRLPIFDITNFQPKLNIPTESTARKTKSDYEMEFIELPQKIPVNGPSSAILNLRPPNLAQEKRRRRNPIPIPIQKYSRIPIHDPRPSHYLLPPNTNKFKLL